jgi:hypothetical protein
MNLYLIPGEVRCSACGSNMIITPPTVPQMRARCIAHGCQNAGKWFQFKIPVVEVESAEQDDAA